MSYHKNLVNNLDLSCFIDSNKKKDNIDNELIPILMLNEKDLKYNKYSFYIDMNKDKNIPNLNEFGIDVEKISNVANAGINLMGQFIKNVNEGIKEFDNKSNTKSNKNQDIRKELKYFKHDDDNYFYIAIEIPRIKREDCQIKVNGNIILINAKTESLTNGFSFLEKQEYEVSITIPFSFNAQQIVAKNSNGMLYISINKNLILDNNIDINILE
tara:strand:+ start:101 stop:742 length:642 start_codon:yes stop_codon:yes gene_type:complete